MNEPRTYHLVVFEAEEGGFWAEVAELTGCVAQGETLDELLEDARAAVDLFLEAMEEEGLKPPSDRFVANLEFAPAS
jgi:predicted RNase H-like HicB family nuclease